MPGTSPTTAPTDMPPLRRAHPDKPPGRYENWKNIVEEAVRTNAPPSPHLIEANTRLSAWEAYLGIGKVSSFPVIMHVTITDVCNARCGFCGYSPDISTNRRLKVEDIERADWLKFCGKLNPNGGLNEPLSHPQIAELLEAIRRQAPFIDIEMTTNASLMSDRLINVVAAYFRRMIVSLNAARKETYEATMPPLKWDKTIDNLRRLRDEKRRQKTDRPGVVASVVAHRHNLEELPELPELLKELDIEGLRIQPMAVRMMATDRQLMTDVDAIQSVPRLANWSFRALEANCEKFGIRLTHALPEFDVAQFAAKAEPDSADVIAGARTTTLFRAPGIAVPEGQEQAR